MLYPGKPRGTSQYNVPGWNDIVQDKYDLSRQAFIDWVFAGKPRCGDIFQHMSRSRANFKLAMRYCRQHEEQLRVDACANSLDLQDAKQFWSNVKKMSNDKATKYANTVNGVTGEQEIADMWKGHFAALYNSVQDDVIKSQVLDRAKNTLSCRSAVLSVYDIITALQKLKKGRAAGPDGINAEAFIYGGHKLYVHIAFLFNLFISHCYLPSEFMQSTVVPLVKVKGGNMQDINNYRAIALSNAFSKILEAVFLPYLRTEDRCDMYQFGFSPGLSTGICTNTFKRCIEYYTQRGSHVFTCFVDFSKAFDTISYWKLFSKLLDDQVSCEIVSLLAYWYSHQETCTLEICTF